MTAIDRFLTYVTFDTTSDETSDTCPSTAKQLILADYLVKELKDIGLTDAMRDENGYVYGHVPASTGMENVPKIGLIAHMDTSPDVSGKDVKPQIITFDGNNAPMVDKRYHGEQLIVTDHTTLLGADDKAGVAEIIAACDVLMKDKTVKHGQISICFTPDEEIGRGADKFDFERFDAVYAYTVDGGELGGIECENFNAASVKLIVHGINTHPGSAKNKMRNAILFLHEFIALLPPAETPAHTEGYEGFYHINAVEGDETTASLHMLIRDHSDEMFEKRKAFIADTVRYLNRKYGENTFDLTITDSYRNMRVIIDKYPEIVKRAENAMRACGVTPEITAIRGGTDGARLSFEGLPCPNLSTGGMGFHSIYEAIPVKALEKMTEVLVKLVSASEA
ncbi:MAG: peptidase T [Eubacteriales bacterium]|jgi:tripeptide aminopeptidase